MVVLEGEEEEEEDKIINKIKIINNKLDLEGDKTFVLLLQRTLVNVLYKIVNQIINGHHMIM